MLDRHRQKKQAEGPEWNEGAKLRHDDIQRTERRILDGTIADISLSRQCSGV
jgi:hypothetical protein